MIRWISEKISALVGIVSFPLKIIPKNKYKQGFDLNQIPNRKRVIIVRRSLQGANTFDRYGAVREDALINGLEDVPGLSLNVLGGFFKPKHISYIPTKKAGKEWIKGEKYLWFKYIKFVIYKFSSVPIYFFFEEIHNKPFPYSKANDSKFKAFIAKHSVPNTVSKNQANVYGACIIRHSPAKLNYWHVELELLDIESRYTDAATTITRKSIKSYSSEEHKNDITKQKWTNQAAYYALNEILVHSAYEKIDLNDYSRIPANLYLEN